MKHKQTQKKAKKLKHQFRSGLEELVAAQLHKLKIDYEYETVKLKYLKPPKPCFYKPDFIIPGSNIIVETKGRFTSSDRLKHILVKEQNPNVDIRFVFSNSRAKLYKGSSTTYGEWCTKNGFQFADKEIPKEWLVITKRPKRLT